MSVRSTDRPSSSDPPGWRQLDAPPTEMSQMPSRPHIPLPTLPVPPPQPDIVPGQFRCVTAMHSRRYELNASLRLIHRTIQPGTFAYQDPPEERVLPRDWVQFVHPEGKTYFYNPNFRIVTEAWIYNSHIHARVVRWANHFFRIVEDQGIRLPCTSELCLELDTFEDGCSYYLVDYARRTEFWVEPMVTESIDLPPVASNTHLKLVLEEHYWRHVEYFPVHLNLADDVENELQGILLHACADAMTSDLSTSPISPDRCQTYLKLLQNLSISPVSRGHKNCVVARLWGEFARNRAINHHGEENARLCRDQLLSSEPETETSLILTIANALLFNVPESHLRSLKKLWVDEVAYTEHWQRYTRLMIREWRESSLGSMIILVTELLLFTTLAEHEASRPEVWQSVQHASSLAAIILASASVLTGVMLTRSHKQYEGTHAADATEFLSDNQHPTLGLRPLATVYAAPFGCLAWSIIFFSVALLLLSFHLKSRLTQTLIWSFCFAAVAISLLIYGLFGRTSALSLVKRRLLFVGVLMQKLGLRFGRRSGAGSSATAGSERSSTHSGRRNRWRAVFRILFTNLGLRSSTHSSLPSSSIPV